MSRHSPQTPLRTCLACRRRADQKELIRLAARGENVVFDPARRLPGRGAYICRRPACLEALLKKRRDAGCIFRRKLGPEAWRGLLSQQDLLDACFHNKEDVRRI